MSGADAIPRTEFRRHAHVWPWPWSPRAGKRSGVLASLLLSLGMMPSVALAQDGAQGLTKQTQLAPFNAEAPACNPPPGLKNELTFVQENEREFLQGVDRGLSQAARNRGLQYSKVLVDDDDVKAAEQIRRLGAAKVGALVATSSDATAVSRSLQQVIFSGAFVGTVMPPPATLIVNAPQYATGKALTDAAIAYINAKLGGKAKVVLLTQDTTQFLSPRFQAMRDGLDKLAGVTIVADIAPRPVSNEGGFATMKDILLADPDIDVVLGADAVVLGALKALRAAGRDRPDQFLGGIDGEPDAVAEIKKASSPYKASIALASPVFGYAMGQFAADWMIGRSVPQAMDILPIALTKDNIARYETDLADPGAVYGDPVRRSAYLKMYGNICYDTRDNYVNFPWSSEQK